MDESWTLERHAGVASGGRKTDQGIDPAFPIIYMTDAAADKWPSRGVPDSILLEKPFAPAQFVTAVSTLLNAGTSTP